MKTDKEMREYIKKTFPKYRPTTDEEAQIIAKKITELMLEVQKVENPKLLYNPFTPETLEQMDRLVKAGHFPSRSSLLRHAVIKLLKESET